VAILPSEVLQVPPEVASVRDVVLPLQTAEAPEIADGVLTEITSASRQPVASRYVITAVPYDTPATTPVTEFIVALLVLLLLQVPPAMLALNEIVAGRHSVAIPEITGVPLTVIVFVALQPVAMVYATVAVPAAMPENIPDPDTIVAILTLDEVHVPPEVPSVSVAVLPAHTIPAPAIAAGTGLTVNTAVFRQPPATVYVILAVPAATPVAIPVAPSIVAVLVLPLLHVPPAVASVNVIVEPAQTEPVPSAGTAWVTVTTAVAVQPAPRL
jgi:hypothetical protein